MRKVTTVNLNGNAYQLEEGAFEALQQYLDGAARALAANPDRDEVLADLEQAIGDKCDTWLGAHKNVVSAREMEQILKEMGPVEGAGPADGASASASSSSSAAAAGGPRRKRLYRLPSEGMLGGVCAGLAAYFDVDVVWVRLGFVLVTLFTGVWILVWLAMLFVMPVAETAEEIADAHGEPLNAREVLERAKKKSAEFARDAGARMNAGLAEAGNSAREFSSRLRERARRRRDFRRRQHRDPPPVPAGSRVVAAVFLPFLSIVSAALFVAFVYVVLSLLVRGEVAGFVPAWIMPPWVAIVVVVLVYLVVAGPIGAARRLSQRYANGGRSFGWASGTDGVFWVLLVVLFFYLGSQLLPELQDWLRDFLPGTRTISV